MATGCAPRQPSRSDAGTGTPAASTSGASGLASAADRARCTAAMLPRYRAYASRSASLS
jgi:hypothetical protein